VTSLGYARSVLRALTELRGPEASVALSPRDWALVLDWERRGIPLAIVLEALREGPGRRRSRRALPGPPRLTEIATAVEEAWEVVRAGAAPTDGPVPPSAGASAASWEDALRAMDPSSSLAALLGGLLARLRAGADPEDLDAALDDGLAGAAPGEIRAAVEADVGRELAPFRALMTPDAFAATHALTVRDRLRKTLGLPRIS
jgi:hypothetical protein